MVFFNEGHVEELPSLSFFIMEARNLPLCLQKLGYRFPKSNNSIASFSKSIEWAFELDQTKNIMEDLLSNLKEYDHVSVPTEHSELLNCEDYDDFLSYDDIDVAEDEDSDELAELESELFSLRNHFQELQTDNEILRKLDQDLETKNRKLKSDYTDLESTIANQIHAIINQESRKFDSFLNTVEGKVDDFLSSTSAESNFYTHTTFTSEILDKRYCNRELELINFISEENILELQKRSEEFNRKRVVGVDKQNLELERLSNRFLKVEQEILESTITRILNLSTSNQIQHWINLYKADVANFDDGILLTSNQEYQQVKERVEQLLYTKIPNDNTESLKLKNFVLPFLDELVSDRSSEMTSSMKLFNNITDTLVKQASRLQFLDLLLEKERNLLEHQNKILEDGIIGEFKAMLAEYRVEIDKLVKLKNHHTLEGTVDEKDEFTRQVMSLIVQDEAPYENDSILFKDSVLKAAFFFKSKYDASLQVWEKVEFAAGNGLASRIESIQRNLYNHITKYSDLKSFVGAVDEEKFLKNIQPRIITKLTAEVRELTSSVQSKLFKLLN